MDKQQAAELIKGWKTTIRDIYLDNIPGIIPQINQTIAFLEQEAHEAQQAAAQTILCPECKGDGFIPTVGKQIDGTYQVDCEICESTGKIVYPSAEIQQSPTDAVAHAKAFVEWFDIILEQAKIIDRLTRNPEHEKCHEEAARYFGVTEMEGTLINSVQFFNVKTNKHMSVSFKAAGGAIATLTPFAKDGVTPAPNGVDLTKPITALSNHPEFFTAAIVVDTNGVPTIPLQAKLNGVADGVGTITYAATSIDGSAIVLVDDVTVADVPPIVPAASFTVEYTVF